MHHHGLRAAAELGVALGAGERHHLIGARDHFRRGRAARSGLRQSFEQAGVVAAEVGENVGDARIVERFEKRRAGGIHKHCQTYHMDAWLTAAGNRATRARSRLASAGLKSATIWSWRF